MFNFDVKNMEYFNSQYKYILEKSNNSLTIESKGFISESYSLYRDIISNIDNILAFYINIQNDCTNDENISGKVKNMKILRENICTCIERLRQKYDLNDDSDIAELIYSLPLQCQYSKINSNDISSAPSPPSSLEIYKFPSKGEDEKGFITVSDWVGSLKKNLTPVLITTEGVIMFFDKSKENIKIALTLPFNLSELEFQIFISILSTLAIVALDGEIVDQEMSNEKDITTGEVIANGMNKASQTLSKGIMTGASKLGDIFCMGSNELCQRIEPGQGQLNSTIKSGFKYARTGSHMIVEASGKVFTILSKTTQYLASKAAPHIIATANNYIPDHWKEKGKNGEISKASQVALVTGSGLQSLSLLFDSLHDGAVIFGRSAIRGSSNIMRHRYGEEIGQTTENALYSAGNLGMAAMVAFQFTKKGILKTAAKITAVKVVDEYRDSKTVLKSSTI